MSEEMTCVFPSYLRSLLLHEKEKSAVILVMRSVVIICGVVLY